MNRRLERTQRGSTITAAVGKPNPRPRLFTSARGLSIEACGRNIHSSRLRQLVRFQHVLTLSDMQSTVVPKDGAVPRGIILEGRSSGCGIKSDGASQAGPSAAFPSSSESRRDKSAFCSGSVRAANTIRRRRSATFDPKSGAHATTTRSYRPVNGYEHRYRRV